MINKPISKIEENLHSFIQYHADYIGIVSDEEGFREYKNKQNDLTEPHIHLIMKPAALEELNRLLKKAEQKSELSFYDPQTTINFDSSHTVRLTFQYEDTFAMIETTMGGNTYGSEIIECFIEFDIGITAPKSNPVNKKYAIFEEQEEEEGRKEYAEVEYIRFFDDRGVSIHEFDIEEAAAQLIKVEIIDYTPTNVE